MKNIIFLEGLPGVGKTTIVNYIASLNLPNIHIVSEIENPDIINNVNSSNQNIYIENDEIKINKYQDGIVIIDRGPLSTLSYNETKHKLNGDFSKEEVTTWFNNHKSLFLENTTYVIYLKNHNNNYYLPYNNDKDPYGSISNQKLLEEITISNCNKYVKNFKIVDYDKKEMKELVNEIIN